MQKDSADNLRGGFISGSGRRFVSDARTEYYYTSFETRNLLRSYAPENSTPLLYKKASFVTLQPHVNLGRDKMLLSFNITSENSGHSYVVRDIMELVRAVDKHEIVSYGKHLEFTHDISAFSEESQKIIGFLRAYFRQKVKGTLSYSYAKGHSKQIEISGHEVDEFFSCVDHLYFVNSDFRARYSDERLLEIVPVFPPIDLHVEKNKNGINFEASAFTMFEGYSYIYFERRKKLHMVPRSDCEVVIPFLNFLSGRRTENELFVAEKDLTLFSTGLLPVIEEYFNVSYDGFEPLKYSPDTPSFRVYIDMPDSETITCDIVAVYQAPKGPEETFRIFETHRDETDKEELTEKRAVRRNHYLESRTASFVSPYFDYIDEKKGLLTLKAAEDTDRLYSFIAEDIPVLNNALEVYLSDSIKEVHIIAAPRVDLGVSVMTDLLELSMVPEDIEAQELSEILSRYRRKKKYFRLKSGEIVNLLSPEMEFLYTLKDGLGITDKEILEGHAPLPKYRALFLDTLALDAEEQGTSHLAKTKAFKELIKSFSDVDKDELKVPDSLSNVLRDYQKDGYRWLLRLKKNGFGGILADDMGLGKTLQVLSMLLAIKEENCKNGIKNGCSLIVCPASLVYNWQHEIKKFTPLLRCELAIGIKPDRERITSEIDEEETDVIITSYDLLRRDISLYKYLSFDSMIIDEAQFIKNPTTQVAKAVKSIKASYKVAMTGTPIENRLSELWSIFDFCMPGYLFSYKAFHDRIEMPVVQDKDEAAMAHLKRMISPFVLRRIKKDVLKDLPDKLEENIVTRMTDEQGELYRAHIQRIRLMVGSKSEDDIKREKIAILSELTRLRQLCCDPGLIYEGYKGGSAKAELCVEMIKAAAESGHKVLLFSQFTSMLERLTKLLEKAGLSYYLLTGSTKKEDRIRLVDAFQENDTNVFCISLKAGGTGLNLTAADIVIHFDHWWNVAVENQATDRAHRIGQKNVVTVYRLIMKDTIEERIIKLQNRKKELADQLLDGENMGSTSFSKEELLELLS